MYLGQPTRRLLVVDPSLALDEPDDHAAPAPAVAERAAARSGDGDRNAARTTIDRDIEPHPTA